ncbi:PH domain-containing protein [Lactiplantibacillus pentosus]|uniref:PH domain-containing protein n=1 Tax=Lactiplantibacillus pentosus TaxID=1589 RepID=UPI003C2A5605
MTEQLPKEIKHVWVASIVLSGGIGLLLTIGVWFGHLWWHWWWWLAVVVGGLTILDIMVELAMVPYRYAFWRYQITTDAVYLHHGVIMKRVIAIPIRRIQNVTLEAGPLLQWQHLQKVVVATSADSYEIDSVVPEVANRLRDRIMQLAREARDEV